MKIIIRGGRILDPANKIDAVKDIAIIDERIVLASTDVGKGLADSKDVGNGPHHFADEDCQIIDASGCFVMPGLIDMHVHLRDPGLTYKEDIESGAKAAAKGGFTTIVAMPNTKPVVDNATGIEYVANTAKATAVINVLQVGAITKGQDGTELADIEGMVRAGSPAISEDGKSVMNAQIYREAMQIAASCEIPVLAHCEDINMVDGGCVNDDETTKRQGLKGISNAVEDVIVARDIIIAKETGAKLHLCHCSTKDSVTMVEEAKRAGVRLSAEVCPHHFTLTTADMIPSDTNYKMNPPLRGSEDLKELKRGLKENIMDVISTDHAPHSAKEKDASMADAPFGIVGLETCVALTISELVRPEVITPMQMAEKCSYNPAQILGLDKGTLSEGAIADVTIIDPTAEYEIDVNDFVSKSKNTPFNRRKVYGKVLYTICNGKIVYSA